MLPFDEPGGYRPRPHKQNTPATTIDFQALTTDSLAFRYNSPPSPPASSLLPGAPPQTGRPHQLWRDGKSCNRTGKPPSSRHPDAANPARRVITGFGDRRPY
ncbi:MAG: hypothetical protein H6658_04720 [Ardenticatenaceae bacterium]|nr:hypothetical protein [Ardenticatenaceae bacterium]